MKGAEEEAAAKKAEEEAAAKKAEEEAAAKKAEEEAAAKKAEEEAAAKKAQKEAESKARKAVKLQEDGPISNLNDCCEAIYRKADLGDKDAIAEISKTGWQFVTDMEGAVQLCDALEDAGCYESLAVTLAALSEKLPDNSRIMRADQADVLDLRLERRDEALDIATPIADGEDRASYKAKAVLAGNDHGKLQALASNMMELLKKLRKSPEEVPFMNDLAHLYSERLGSLKDAEDLYKRIKLAEPKNSRMLRFYCRYYESTGEWQRVLSFLQTLKGVVAGSYRELNVSREIARISEEKLNNPAKAVSVWNQMLRDGVFVDVAREELIALYQRMQRWQPLLDIYKNDFEAADPENKEERIGILKKSIEIYDKYQHNDGMVLKLYHQILDIDPSNDEAVDALIDRYESAKRWNELLKILNQKAESVEPENRVDIYYRIASIFSTNLGNTAKSIEPLNKIVEIDPTQVKALRQLHEFYEQGNKYANLYDVIAKEAAVADGGEKISFYRRQAEIAENNLHSPEKAIESWETMSKCLEDPGEALVELVRLYKKQSDYESLLSVYERCAEFAHNEPERIENMEHMAELYLGPLNAREKGIETLRKMLDIEEGRDQALEQLTQLFRESEDWDAMCSLYVELDMCAQLYELLDLTASDVSDEKVQIGLYERMANVASEHLKDDDLVVSAYEKVLGVDPKHEATARKLLDYYTARGEHSKAIDAIQIIIGWTEDKDEKVSRHVQIANLYENELSEFDKAASWYAKAVALDPEKGELRAHFEELVEKADANSLLYDVYSELCNDENNSSESRVAMHRSLARACQQKLDKCDDAIKSWEFCLASNNADMEAIDALCELYEQAASWEKLLGVLDKKLELADDPEEVKSLSFRRAELLVSQIENLEEAEKSYQRILEIEDDNIDAIHGLKAIYDTTENWSKLVGILQKEKELATDNRIDVTFELAEVYRNHLDKTSEAIDLYASILDEDGTDERTIRTLEELIRNDVEAARLASILEPVYERAGEYAKQCEAIEIRLKSLEQDEKLSALWHVYTLRHDVLHDSDAAFDASVRLFGMTPEDEKIWDNLAELAGASDNHEKWEKVSALYAGIEANDDNAWSYELLRRRALILEEELSKEDESIALWEQLHAHDEGNLEPIHHLEKLYKNCSAFDKLVALYEFEVGLPDFSDDERIQIHLAAAQIYEDILEKSDEAIRVFRAILEIDNSREEAHEALERLYTSNEMWSELAALYEDELSLYTDSDRLKSIRGKLAVVSNEHLGNYERAIECYQTLLEQEHDDDVVDAAFGLLRKLVDVEDEKAPEHRASLCELLEPIFIEKSRLADLIELLRIKLNDCGDAFEKVELNRRIATILRDDLKDDEGAFAAFSAALKIDVSDENLRGAFEELAFKLDRPAEIIGLYEESLNGVEEEGLRHDLLKRVAHIQENVLQDASKAIEAYRKMLEIDDSDRETLDQLESLYTNEQNWTELIDILKRKSDIGTGDEKVDILRKMATINGDCISDTKAAIACYQEILENVSDDMDALNALESLYSQTEDWEHLSDNYGIKLQLATENDDKRNILQEMAAIQENHLKNFEEAIQLHVQILDLFPEDEKALDALDSLYLGQECYDDLAEILRKKLELHRDSEVADTIEYRLGQVYQTKLNSIEQAIEYYKSILERRPEHQEAHDALRGLLDNEDYRIEASRVLESVYARTEQNEKLCEMLEIQLADESDPYAQVELLKRIANIHQDKLSDYEAAFKDYARILKNSQDEGYVVQIEALSEILNNTPELVEVYKNVVQNVYEPDMQVAFNNKIADLVLNQIGDETEAENYYRASLEIQSDDAHALDALDGIYTRREAWKDLLGILASKLNAVSEPDAQLPLLYRTAEIQETRCEEHDEAIENYQRILEIDSDADKARQALSTIYEQQNMWNELSDLIRSEISGVVDTDIANALKFKLAKVQNEKLEDATEAIQTLQDILSTDSSNAAASGYLESLFEAGTSINEIAEILEPIYKSQNAWNKLIHSLEVRAEHEEDVFSKTQILDEIARTWSDNLNNSSKALETYGRILVLQPTEADVQNKVETLAAQTGELNVWADLYTKIIDENLVEDYSDKRVLMLSLARLEAERLGNSEKACKLCEQMLEEDAEELEAYGILEWCYAQKSDYASILNLWVKKAEIVQDQNEKLALLLKIATIQEEVSHDDMAACKTYKEMLEIDQKAESAAPALERLLRKTEQFEELAEFYRSQSDFASSDTERAEYLHKLGAVLFSELHNTQEAVEVLGNALSIQPSSTACKRAVEKMLDETAAVPENAEIRNNMAVMLEPLYSDDEWNKLARVLDVMIDVSEDDMEKVGLYMRLAALYEAHDLHRRRAFDTYAKAFTLMPSTTDARDKVEAIAQELGNSQLLADVYEKAIQACEDDTEKISLYERSAEIYTDSIKDSEKAAECYEAILKLDDTHIKSITALESLYSVAKKYDKQVEVLRKHAELTPNMLDQKDLFYRIAEIQEKVLKKPEDAIATYRSILELDSEDQISLDALETLYGDSENWEELIVILKHKIDASTEVADRISLNVSIAKVYKNNLNDVDNAIEFYVQALNENPENIDVLSALEGLYTETNRCDDLLETIQAKIDYAGKNDDAQLKQQNELKLADILIEKADEKSRAIEVLSSVLRDDDKCARALEMLNALLTDDALVPDISAILMPLYKDAGKDEDYLRICERQIEISSDDFEKRSLYLDAATVADEKLNDVSRAFEFISPAFLAAPSDDEIIGKAEAIAEHHDAYDRMTALCEKTVKEADDPDASLKLSLIAARLYEEKLGNVEKTIEQFERVLEIDALNEEALENLHRLYKQVANREKLAAVLQKRIEVNAQPINDIRYELVELKLVEEPKEALELLKQILWDDAENENAIAALEELLVHKELTLEIAEFLEPHYNKTGENEKLVDLLRAKVSLTEDPADAVVLLKQIADIELNTLHNEKDAFDTYVTALNKEPSDVELMGAVETLAEKLELWRDLAEAYDCVLKCDDADKLAIYAKQAAVYDDKLDDAEKAKTALKAILELDAENLDALKRLDAIYAKLDDKENLLETKTKLSELIFDADEQKKILYQCADLALNSLNLNERGITYLEKIVELDDHEMGAINPLLVLYEEAGKFDKYAELINKKLLNLDSDDERFNTYVKLAEVSNAKLDDPAAAIEAYQNALNIRHEKDVYVALEGIFEKHEQYQELDELYMSWLDSVSDNSVRAELYIKRSNIADKQFHDDMQAIDLLKDALNADPTNAAAFNGLDAIYSRNENFQDLYDLLVEQKEKATSEDLILTFNIRIAKLAATHLGDTDKAIESLKEVLATRSDNMEAINSLIDIYEQQKSYDLALMMLKKKENNVHTNEEKSEVYCHVARLIQKGNWDISQVENSYNAALTLNPKNETALKALFDIAKEAGNIGKQIKLLNVRANNADDADEKNKIYMSIADLADANEGYAKESAEALAKVYETKQDDAELAERLINTYIKADMIDQAVPVLDSIIKNLSDAKQNKRLPPFYSIKGRMLKKSGDLLGARAAFEAAAAIDKNNIPNNLELGILLYEEENYDASLKIMQTLLLHQMNVKDKDIKTNIFYYLGMLRVKTNDPKRAKDMFTRALGVNPNHEPTKEALASL
ncbi:MAG: hypothetical protein IJU23_15165 [Proteobacteria bacterium]|nr:hypothetical protein [Pseudomonadota bacterium]